MVGGISMTASPELLSKLNTEQLLMRVIRYHKLVNLGAPVHLRSNELVLILQSICNAISDMPDYAGATDSTHENVRFKDFIDEEHVLKYSKYHENFFKDATEETLNVHRYKVNESLLSRLDELNDLAEILKKEEELEVLHKKSGISNLEQYKLEKEMKKDLKEWGFIPED